MKKEDCVTEKQAILEGMTSLSALLNTPRTINDRQILRVLIDQSKRKSKAAEIGFLTAKSKEWGFPVSFVEKDEIDAYADGGTHGGILAICTDRTVAPLRADAITPNGFYAYLEGIEDPYNFGNALRSLYAAGVDGVILPERNWLSAAGIVSKASAGASERLPMLWADGETLTSVFHQVGYCILCAGIRDSVSVFEESFSLPILLVIGGEKRGISRSILENADQIVRIDYGRDFRGSLSASASAAVLAFEIMRQNRMK